MLLRPSLAWLKATLAGVVLALAVGIGAEAQVNPVVDASFESGGEIAADDGSDWIGGAGEWGGDSSAMVLAENTVLPADGSRMLKFRTTTSVGGAHDDVSYVVQLVDLGASADLIAGGDALVLASALFNRVAGHELSDNHFEVAIHAWAGDPNDFLSRLKAEGVGARLASASNLLATDGNPASWEENFVSMTLPAETTYLEVRLGAVENVSDDELPGEFDGHYADHVVVEVTSRVDALAQAADAEGLVWTTGGDAPWTLAHDVKTFGSSAIKNGRIGNRQQSWVETVVQGPGLLSFQWKASSEGADRLRFLIDGAEQKTIGGSMDWSFETFEISDGEHTLRWRYTKDGSIASGADTVWLDQVGFGSGFPLDVDIRGDGLVEWSPVLSHFGAGSSVTLEAFPDQSQSFQGWRGALVSTNSVVTVVMDAQKVVTANFGAPLGEAVERPELVWISGGDATWRIDESESAFGGTSVRNGIIGNRSESWVETVVQGPGLLSFQWKASSEGADRLRFLIDGAEQKSIGGIVDWAFETFDIADGEHTLRWHYTKDGSIANGADTVWLDQVGFGTGFPLDVDIRGAGEVAWDPPIPHFENDAVVTLTATPGDGETFQGWRGSVVSTNRVVQLRMDELKVVTANFGRDFGPAVERSELVWISGGNAPWRLDENDSAFGASSIRNGSIGNQQESWVETVIQGPGLLSFQWKASSEGADRLRFLIDGEEQKTISGITDWVFENFFVADGEHVLRWRYTKDGSISSGADTVWLDQVGFGRGYPIDVDVLGEGLVTWDPARPHFNRGEVVTLTATPGEDQSFQGWRGDIASIENKIALPIDRLWRVTANFGSNLGEALESPELVWTTGGDSTWLVTTQESVAGGSSVQNGGIGNRSSTWIETEIQGPGTLSFQWKVSSEGADPLRFFIDGSQVDRIAGQVDWMEKSAEISEGQHVLRWTYSKDGSIASFQDTAWLDQVRYEPTEGSPVISPLSDVVVRSGDPIQLAAVVSGTGPFTHEWLRGGVLIPGGAAAVYEKASAGKEDQGAYSLRVSNASGSTESTEFLVRVIDNPVDEVIADSIVDFIGPEQGVNGWEYGYYNRTQDGDDAYNPETDFQVLPQFEGRWYVEVGSGGFWTSLGALSVHPNGTQTSGGRLAEEHWTIRRWVSQVSGVVRVQGRIAKDNVNNDSDGVAASVLLNGNSVYETEIGSRDGTGVLYEAVIDINDGDRLDFVLAPIVADAGDATDFSAQVVLLENAVAAEPPAIVSHPVGGDVFEGSSVRLQVMATGSEPLSYSWIKDGEAVSGGDTSTLEIGSATVADSGTYSVRVSNQAGQVASESVVVNVESLSGDIYDIGASFSLPQTPADSTNFIDGTDGFDFVPEADLLVTELGHYDHDGDGFRSDHPVGIYQTNSRELIVGPVTITSESRYDPATGFRFEPVEGVVLRAGETYTAAGFGSGPVFDEYIWRPTGGVMVGDGIEVVAARSSGGSNGLVFPTRVYSSIPNEIYFGQSFRYRIQSPTWIEGPDDVSLVAGEELRLSVAFGGAAPLQYQWSKDGQIIAGIEGAELVIDAVALDDAGVYSVTAQNVAGDMMSREATVVVSEAVEPVTIVSQPVGVTVEVEDSIELSVQATGSAPLLYRWTKDGQFIANAREAILAIASVSLSDAGSYQAIVANGAGEVLSSVAVVEVTEPVVTGNAHPADLNEDFVMSIGEVTAYGAAWKRGDPWSIAPEEIPIAYLTRAGALWRGGEDYLFDESVLEAPLWWVNVGADVGLQSVDWSSEADSNGLTRVVEEVEDGIKVSVEVDPLFSTLAYAAEESAPAGVDVLDVSGDGVLDTESGTVKWGPYFDSEPRTLTYVVSGDLASEPIEFRGTGSFDGEDANTLGIVVVGSGGSSDFQLAPVVGMDGPGLAISGPEGAVLTIESATSLDEADWVSAGQVSLVGGSAVWVDPNGLERQARFYRVVFEE